MKGKEFYNASEKFYQTGDNAKGDANFNMGTEFYKKGDEYKKKGDEFYSAVLEYFKKNGDGDEFYSARDEYYYYEYTADDKKKGDEYTSGDEYYDAGDEYYKKKGDEGDDGSEYYDAGDEYYEPGTADFYKNFLPGAGDLPWEDGGDDWFQYPDGKGPYGRKLAAEVDDDSNRFALRANTAGWVGKEGDGARGRGRDYGREWRRQSDRVEAEWGQGGGGEWGFGRVNTPSDPTFGSCGSRSSSSTSWRSWSSRTASPRCRSSSTTTRWRSSRT